MTGELPDARRLLAAGMDRRDVVALYAAAYALPEAHAAMAVALDLGELVSDVIAEDGQPVAGTYFLAAPGGLLDPEEDSRAG